MLEKMFPPALAGIGFGDGGDPVGEFLKSEPDLLLGPDFASTGGGRVFYRGMVASQDGGPELGASAKMLGARQGTDINADDGLVRPKSGGMSVNESPTGMPAFRRPPSFGGSGKDLRMYCIRECDIPPGLRYTPESGGHGFFEPSDGMTFEDYQNLVQGTRGLWSEVLPLE